jgi:hypothetical protein
LDVKYSNSFFYSALQLPNIKFACGSMGDNNTFSMFLDVNSYDYGDYGNAYVQLTQGASFSNIAAFENNGNVANLDPSGYASPFGTTVTPNTIITGSAINTVRRYEIKVQCAGLAAAPARLRLYAYGGADDIYLGNLVIPACGLETCGGQGIRCPGLQADQPCTPGVFMNACIRWGY